MAEFTKEQLEEIQNSEEYKQYLEAAGDDETNLSLTHYLQNAANEAHWLKKFTVQKENAKPEDTEKDAVKIEEGNKTDAVREDDTDVIYQNINGLMEVRIQHVTFTKHLKDGEIVHNSRIITYGDKKKKKVISLLTNDMEAEYLEIIDIYRKRWEIELLFKQMKQNFPLKYFYGENANAIKIQIWITLIANLLLMVMQKGLNRSWSFSGLATMVRITLMYYVDFYSLFNNPEKDWESHLNMDNNSPPELSLF